MIVNGRFGQILIKGDVVRLVSMTNVEENPHKI